MPEPRLPRISIVTPSLDQAPFVAATVESVLLQDYPDLELLVQDGGSTDLYGLLDKGGTVPEPTPLALALVGFAALGLRRAPARRQVGAVIGGAPAGQ